MRTLIAIAFATLLGATAAQAAEPAQVAAKEPATAIARTEPLTTKEAREVARTFMKDNKVRQGRVGEVKQKDGNYVVELRSADGIPFKTLTIDAATGEIKG